MELFLRFFNKPRNLFYLGFTACFLITLLDVIRGGDHNFRVFSDSTVDFWNGISPYTAAFVERHGRFFLYSPVFSVLFSPFAFLPEWLGPFVWNLFNYVLFFLAIFTLPDKYTVRQKCATFLFLLLILAQSLFSYQYNIVIAYLFLFAYGLLEKGKSFWAILLMLIAGYTKVFGIFQLGLLLFYPKFWKNIGYVVFWSVVIMALPLLKLSFPEFIPYYREWFNALSAHRSDSIFDSVFYAYPIRDLVLPYFRYVQIISIVLIGILFLRNYDKRNSFEFRAKALGVLMAWIILFSDSAEKHTYIIAFAGYLLWYWNHNTRRLDKVLLGANFLLLCVVPIDILCPTAAYDLLCRSLWINIWIFFFTWLRMVATTFSVKKLSEK